LDAGDPLWTAFRAVGGIPLPPNLVVVGTVNMDETPHGFSRKLLPRLEGDEDKLGLGRDGNEATFLDAVADDWKGRFGEAWDGSRTKRKLEFMSARLRRSGFTTYWPYSRTRSIPSPSSRSVPAGWSA
jgi:hypothetical protein